MRTFADADSMHVKYPWDREFVRVLNHFPERTFVYNNPGNSYQLMLELYTGISWRIPDRGFSYVSLGLGKNYIVPYSQGKFERGITI